MLTNPLPPSSSHAQPLGPLAPDAPSPREVHMAAQQHQALCTPSPRPSLQASQGHTSLTPFLPSLLHFLAPAPKQQASGPCLVCERSSEGRSKAQNEPAGLSQYCISQKVLVKPSPARPMEIP